MGIKKPLERQDLFQGRVREEDLPMVSNTCTILYFKILTLSILYFMGLNTDKIYQ